MEEERPDTEVIQVGKRRSSLGALSKSKPVTKLKSMFENKGAVSGAGTAPRPKDSGFLAKLKPVSVSHDATTFSAALAASFAPAASQTVSLPAPAADLPPATPMQPLFGGNPSQQADVDLAPHPSPPLSTDDGRTSPMHYNESLCDGSDADGKSSRSPGSAGFLKRMGSSLKKALTPKSSSGKQKRPSYTGSDTSNISPRPSGQLTFTPHSQPSSTSMDLNGRSDQMQPAPPPHSPGASPAYEVHSARDDQDWANERLRDVGPDAPPSRGPPGSAKPPLSPQFSPAAGTVAVESVTPRPVLSPNDTTDVPLTVSRDGSPNQAVSSGAVSTAGAPMGAEDSFMSANPSGVDIMGSPGSQDDMANALAASLTASPTVPAGCEGAASSPPMREVNMGAGSPVQLKPIASPTPDAAADMDDAPSAHTADLVFPSLSGADPQPASSPPPSLAAASIEAPPPMEASDVVSVAVEPVVDTEMDCLDVALEMPTTTSGTGGVALATDGANTNAEPADAGMDVDMAEAPFRSEPAPAAEPSFGALQPSPPHRNSFGTALGGLDLSGAVASSPNPQSPSSPCSPDATTPTNFGEAADTCIIGLTPVRPDTVAAKTMADTPTLSTVAESPPEQPSVSRSPGVPAGTPMCTDGALQFDLQPVPCAGLAIHPVVDKPTVSDCQAAHSPSPPPSDIAAMVMPNQPPVNRPGDMASSAEPQQQCTADDMDWDDGPATAALVASEAPSDTPSASSALLVPHQPAITAGAESATSGEDLEDRPALSPDGGAALENEGCLAVAQAAVAWVSTPPTASPPPAEQTQGMDAVSAATTQAALIPCSSPSPPCLLETAMASAAAEAPEPLEACSVCPSPAVLETVAEASATEPDAQPVAPVMACGEAELVMSEEACNSSVTGAPTEAAVIGSSTQPDAEGDAPVASPEPLDSAGAADVQPCNLPVAETPAPQPAPQLSPASPEAAALKHTADSAAGANAMDIDMDDVQDQEAGEPSAAVNGGSSALDVECEVLSSCTVEPPSAEVSASIATCTEQEVKATLAGEDEGYALAQAAERGSVDVSSLPDQAAPSLSLTSGVEEGPELSQLPIAVDVPAVAAPESSIGEQEQAPQPQESPCGPPSASSDTAGDRDSASADESAAPSTDAADLVPGITDELGAVAAGEAAVQPLQAAEEASAESGPVSMPSASTELVVAVADNAAASVPEPEPEQVVTSEAGAAADADFMEVDNLPNAQPPLGAHEGEAQPSASPDASEQLDGQAALPEAAEATYTAPEQASVVAPAEADVERLTESGPVAVAESEETAWNTQQAHESGPVNVSQSALNSAGQQGMDLDADLVAYGSTAVDLANIPGSAVIAAAGHPAALQLQPLDETPAGGFGVADSTVAQPQEMAIPQPGSSDTVPAAPSSAGDQDTVNVSNESEQPSSPLRPEVSAEEDPMMVSPMPLCLVMCGVADPLLPPASPDAPASAAQSAGTPGMPTPISPETAHVGVRAFQLEDIEEPEAGAEPLAAATELPPEAATSANPAVEPIPIMEDTAVAKVFEAAETSLADTALVAEPAPTEPAEQAPMHEATMEPASSPVATHPVVLTVGAPVQASSPVAAPPVPLTPVAEAVQALTPVAAPAPSSPPVAAMDQTPTAAAVTVSHRDARPSVTFRSPVKTPPRDVDVPMADSLEAIEALWGNDDLLTEAGPGDGTFGPPLPLPQAASSPVSASKMGAGNGHGGSARKVAPDVVLQVQRESLDLFSLRNSVAGRVSDSLMVESLDSFEGAGICAKSRAVGFIPMAPLNEASEQDERAEEEAGSPVAVASFGGAEVAGAPAPTSQPTANLTFTPLQRGTPASEGVPTPSLQPAAAGCGGTPSANRPAALTTATRSGIQTPVAAPPGSAALASSLKAGASASKVVVTPAASIRANTAPATALKALAAANAGGTSASKPPSAKRITPPPPTGPKPQATPLAAATGQGAAGPGARTPGITLTPGVPGVRPTPMGKGFMPSPLLAGTPAATAALRAGLTPRSSALPAGMVPASARTGLAGQQLALTGRAGPGGGLFDTPTILRAAAVPLADSPFPGCDFDLDISAEATRAIAMLGAGEGGEAASSGAETAVEQGTPVLATGAARTAGVTASTPTLSVMETHVQLLTSKLAETEALLMRTQEENAMLRDQVSTLQFESSMTNDLDMEREARQFLEQELAVVRHRSDEAEAGLRTASDQLAALQAKEAELVREMQAKEAEWMREKSEMLQSVQAMLSERDEARSSQQQAEARFNAALEEAQAAAAAAITKCEQESAKYKELQATLGLQAHQLVQVQRLREEAEAKFQKAMEQLIAAQTTHKKQVVDLEQKIAQQNTLIQQFVEMRERYRQVKQHAIDTEQRAQRAEAKAQEAATALNMAQVEKAELLRMCNELLTQLEATKAKAGR